MASRGVNKVILIGNLGADPEVRHMPNGNPVASLRVATTERWKDQSGQAQERTEWHRVSVFGKLAEIAGQYLRKGSSIYLEGSIRTRKWQDKEGIDRYTTEIIAREFTMLGNGREGSNNQAASATDTSNASLEPVSDNDDIEDDMPF